MEADTTDSFSYADGLRVEGTIIEERVKLGNMEVQQGPLLLAQNATQNDEPVARTGKSVGILGLTMANEQTTYSRYRRQSVFDVFGEDRLGEDSGGKKLTSFFKDFWEEHAEIPQTFLLSFGGSKPRMVVGADLEHGPEARGLTFMADIFTTRSNLWYTSLRAIGFSMAPQGGAAGGSGEIVYNLDFNQFSLEGLPTRLDSGSKNIRVGHLVFERLLANMGDGRCRVNEDEGIDCPCSGGAAIATEFPWISLSFETYDNTRILGFDMGKDMRVCIPPSAYVTALSAGTCRLAIVDAGLYQKFFGLEGVVLGVPFFKSVSVGMDLARRRLAFGAPAFPGMPGMSSGGGMTGEAVQVQAGGMSPQTANAACPCADPKNWWNTGHRYSPTRVAVVLCGTAATLLYVFLAFSPSNEGLRTQLDGIFGGAHNPSQVPSAAPGGPGPGGANRPADRGPQPDRQFVQMTGPPYGGPE